VQALLRMRAEEASGRLEVVMATSTSRARWMGGHLLIAGLGTLTLLAVAGASGTVAYGLLTGDWATGAKGMLAAAVLQAPAALALGGLVVAAIALVPRWAGVVGWSALGTSLVMGQLGALLELPQGLLNLSPFTHVPAFPAQELDMLPLALLSAATAVLVGLGVVVFRRRDLVLTA
jgi:ABC-2 type transport system permease protein